jgi:NAD-dependent deacetylase
LTDLAATLAEVREALGRAGSIVVLTGAGVSAESGVPTFRDARSGFWARLSPEELATPVAFERDPELVWRWYRERIRGVMACRPNAAHQAIARLLAERPGVTLVTQNVDGLHQLALEECLEEEDAGAAAGIRERILPLHGNLLSCRCTSCTHREPAPTVAEAGAWTEESAPLPRCARCGARGRPDVVWFGEMLPEETLTQAFEAAGEADICLVVGTSAVVHPAASIPLATLRSGGRIAEVNPERTPLSDHARWRLPGPAASILPELLDVSGT